MSNSRIHIDQLFSKGLENLEIPIPSNSFDSIRKDIDSDNPVNEAPFQNFELEVTDADWLKLKERLAKEITIASEPAESVEESLQELELAVTDSDWQILKDRLAKENRKPVIPLPFNEIKSAFKDFEIGVTDADWKATQSKLNNFRKKKMIWWWWLNMVILGALAGLAFQYLEPLKSAQPSASNTIINQVQVKTENAVTPYPNANAENEKVTVNSEKPADLNSITDIENASDDKHKPKNTEQIASDAVKHSSIQLVKKDRIVSNATPNLQYNVKLNPNPASSEQTLSYPISGKNTSQQENVVTSESTETPATDFVSSLNNKSENKVVINGLPKDVAFNSTVTNKVVEVKPSLFEVKLNNVNVNNIDTPKKTKSSTTITPPPFTPNRFKFYAGIVTDVATTYRKLDKSNEASYNTIRNNADKPFTQFSYGLTMGVINGKNQFQTGLQLTEQHFTSSYNYTQTKYDSLFVYNTNHQIIGWFLARKRDTTINTTETVSIKKIDIPFSYKRSWKLDTKTQFIAGIYGTISVNTKCEGTLMLNPANNQLYNYSSLKGAERKFGISPGINIGVQRELSKRLIIQGDVYGKYSLTNRFDTSFSMKQYPYSKSTSNFNAKEYLYSYGLSIKLLYLINK